MSAKPKKKDKDRLPNPVIPTCPSCQKPVLHCECKSNTLKK